MRRNRGAWLTILCILVVGVSVTKLTKTFVASKTETAAAFDYAPMAGGGGPETARITVEIPDGAAAAQEAGAPAGGGAEVSASEEMKEAALAAGAKSAADSPGDGPTPMIMTAPRDVSASETVPETAEFTEEEVAEETPEEVAVAMAAADDAAPYADMKAADAGQTSGEAQDEEVGPGYEEGTPGEGLIGGAAGDGAQYGDTSGPGAPEQSSATRIAAAQELTETDGGTSDGPQENALSETVKSPLDPTVRRENIAEKVVYTSGDLKKRLDSVSSQLSKNDVTPPVSSSDPGVYYAAAEYEYNLWNSELSLISQTLLGKMSVEEAEDYKAGEVEWLRSRDQAAGAAAKNGIRSAQEAEHIRTASQETKKRCYSLVEEYSEILDRNEN